MDTKRCTKCGEEKSVTEFTKKARNKDGLNSRCRHCTRKTVNNHYSNNKDYYKTKAHDHDKKVKKYIREVREKNVCVSCGEDKWWRLDFHHRNKDEKEYSIAAMRGQSLSVVQEELNKCDVLCANCHRDVHHLERN